MRIAPRAFKGIGSSRSSRLPALDVLRIIQNRFLDRPGCRDCGIPQGARRPARPRNDPKGRPLQAFLCVALRLAGMCRRQLIWKRIEFLRH